MIDPDPIRLLLRALLIYDVNGKIGEAGKCKKKERERKRMMEKEKIHRIAMGSKKNKDVLFYFCRRTSMSLIWRSFNMLIRRPSFSLLVSNSMVSVLA